MALDFMIEAFAHNVFLKPWNESEVSTKEKILHYFRDECTKEKNYAEAWDKVFDLPISCRYLLFKNIYLNEIDFKDALKFGSLSDIYSCMTLHFDNEYLFGDLNVFEKMFATCALTHHMQTEIKKQGRLDVSKYIDIIWAMYFDKFTKQFYEEGGWNELKKVAQSYDKLMKFLCIYPEQNIYLSMLKESLVNYCKFKYTVKHEKCSKKSYEKIHVSVLWSKYQVEHFEERFKVSSKYKNSGNNSDIEQLLQEVKLTLNFYFECDKDNFIFLEDKLEENFYPIGMPYSVTLDGSEDIKTDNPLSVQILNMLEELCDKNSNANKNFIIEHQNVILTSDKKSMGNVIGNNSETSETVSSGTETLEENREADGYLHKVSDNNINRIQSPQSNTDIKNSTKTADLNLNEDFTSRSFEGIEKILEGISSINVETQNEPMYLEDVSPTNQKGGSEFCEATAEKNVNKQIDFSFQNEIFESYREEKGYSGSLSGSNFYSKNEETFNKNAELICASSVNEATATLCEENEIPEKSLSSTEDCLLTNEVTKNSDGKIRTDMELDKIREEQEDPEMVNFLRMILVLGNRQGMRHVLGTLQSNEDEKNSPKKSKKKKRSKKKADK